MNAFPYPLSFCLTAVGTLLLVAGLLLPAAFGSAGAQALDVAPPAQIAQPSNDDAQTPRTNALVRRDPFLPDEQTAATQAQADTLVMSQMMRLPPGMRLIASIDAPNAAERKPETRSEGINGIVVGDRPYALVDMDGKTRLLTVGDMFQGRKIVNIALQGVTFDDHSIAHIPLTDQ